MTRGGRSRPAAGPGGDVARVYPVAGLRVRSRVALPGLDEGGWTDGEVSVEFVGPVPVPDGWHALPAQCGCEGTVAGDGSALRIAETAGSARGIAVRQAVPFAAILQGKVTLHAAGAACAGGVAAFTGASGVGKSTLAAALARTGSMVCTDDLLPCRLAGGRVVTPLPRPDGTWELAPLVRVYFLRTRGARAAAVGCAAVPAREAVLELVRNGFGELALAGVWRTQLDAYVAIAEQAASFALRLPDGLDRLEAAAWEIAAMLAAGAGSEAPR